MPILNYLLQLANSKHNGVDRKARQHVRALILAPTRELALQVSSHLNSCLNPVNVNPVDIKQEEDEEVPTLLEPKVKGKGKAKVQGSAADATATKSKGPPLVSVAAIVGGMSAQKQRRILDRGVDILVATPGRLWDILQEVWRTLCSHHSF